MQLYVKLGQRYERDSLRCVASKPRESTQRVSKRASNIDSALSEAKHTWLFLPTQCATVGQARWRGGRKAFSFTHTGAEGKTACQDETMRWQAAVHAALHSSGVDTVFRLPNVSLSYRDPWCLSRRLCSAPLSEVRFIHVHVSTQSDKFAVYADAKKWPNSFVSQVFHQNDHFDMHRVVQISRQSRRRRRRNFTSSPLFDERQRFLRLNFNTDVAGNDFKSSNDSLWLEIRIQTTLLIPLGAIS